MTIRWERSEDGYVDSKCGRWSIVPRYCGTTRPQFYELYDVTLDSHRAVASGDTQAICKAEAQDIADGKRK